ncbi:MAG TPA: glutaredoxin family protein [Terriglobia bacterium]|nr:glutaredoxin family protein [Terriglobia bacterium]
MPESSHPIRVEIYSRPGCHLCDEAKAVVEGYREKYSLVLESINVESSADLENRYGEHIPVVLLDGREAFRYRVDGNELERKLKALWNK